MQALQSQVSAAFSPGDATVPRAAIGYLLGGAMGFLFPRIPQDHSGSGLEYCLRLLLLGVGVIGDCDGPQYPFDSASIIFMTTAILTLP